jgi:hypothetical protein
VAHPRELEEVVKPVSRYYLDDHLGVKDATKILVIVTSAPTKIRMVYLQNIGKFAFTDKT